MNWLLIALGAGGLCLTFVALLLYPRLQRWMFTYLVEWWRRGRLAPGQPVHVLLCVADHFEPRHGQVSLPVARERLRRWVEDYPRLFARFRDADGRPPQHTFFYPVEQYDEEEVSALADLCLAGFGEVEIHLHHHDDSADALRERLLAAKALLAQRHGLLARTRDTGEPAYGFIHGDWALDNSHPQGRCCGVDNELAVLLETGCYADFTLPSAPEPTQTSKINSIYYAKGTPGCRKGHDHGIDVGRGTPPDAALLMIQGPLVLNWRRRKWGLLPRIENSCLQGSQPPEPYRVDLWLSARIQVPARPDWFFVKLHTHGAVEENQAVLLGDAMIRLHESLAERARTDPQFHFHYVTAREMANLVKAAEAGWQGGVDEARDYALVREGAHTNEPVSPLLPVASS